MKLYTSGPMRSKPLFNFPTFREAREVLREMGHEVRCPAEQDEDEGFDPAKGTLEGFDVGKAFQRDLADIIWADGIVLLPGWEESRGSKAELALAKALEKHVFKFDLSSKSLIYAPSVGVVANVERREMGGQVAPDLQEPQNPGVESPFSTSTLTETRVTSATGGQKGMKQARLGLLPPNSLTEVAKVAGFGAAKYSDHNWRKGFPWVLSYDALFRHVLNWLDGEDSDPESKLHPLAHAAWHCLILMEFEDIAPEYDDRMSGARVENEVGEPN